MKLVIENLDYERNSKKFLENININVKQGEFVGLIGPNGSGKTTLLKNIYRSLSPSKGSIYIDSENIKSISNKDLSKILAIVMQENNLEFDFTVKEIVSMARFSAVSRFSKMNTSDKIIILDAIKKVGLEDYLDRHFLSLSGGEKQRVMLALAICQNTDFIILDEPTNHLDIKNQLEIMDMLKRLKITTFLTLHDMNIAAYYCDYVYVMKEGSIVNHGTIPEVFTEEMFRLVFGVNTHIFENPYTKKLNVSYLSPVI